MAGEKAGDSFSNLDGDHSMNRLEVNMNNLDPNIEPPKLSPTPRKSERERKNISYDKLNKGAANSDEEDLELREIGKKKLEK